MSDRECIDLLFNPLVSENTVPPRVYRYKISWFKIDNQPSFCHLQQTSVRS